MTAKEPVLRAVGLPKKTKNYEIHALFRDDGPLTIICVSHGIAWICFSHRGGTDSALGRQNYTIPGHGRHDGWPVHIEYHDSDQRPADNPEDDAPNAANLPNLQDSMHADDGGVGQTGGDRPAHEMISHTVSNTTTSSDHGLTQQITCNLGREAALEQEQMALRTAVEEYETLIQAELERRVIATMARVVEPEKFFSRADIKYEETGYIDEGSFGRVYRAEVHGSQFAIKVIPIDMNNTRKIEDLATEVKSLRAAAHPHVVLFMGISIAKNQFIILMERMSCSLYTLLHDRQDIEEERLRNITLTYEMKLDMCRQILCALNYLHIQLGMLHNDLKPANLLLDPTMKLKISDFGFAMLISEAKPGPAAGTVPYKAPELTEYYGFRGPSKASDMFAVTFTLFELLFEVHLFAPSVNLYKDVTVGGKRPTITQDVPNTHPRRKLPDYLIDAFVCSWDQDPTKRLTAAEMLERVVRAQQEYEKEKANGGVFYRMPPLMMMPVKYRKPTPNASIPLTPKPPLMMMPVKYRKPTPNASIPLTMIVGSAPYEWRLPLHMRVAGGLYVDAKY
ncbi:Serine/threonine-protein kinase, active site [Pelomyxa schiedti]|nr:Serine/threonine-protein kinase, active site [Pelomyxa schiedti]